MKVRTFACAELLVAAMGRNEASDQNAVGDTLQVLNMMIASSAVINREKNE